VLRHRIDYTVSSFRRVLFFYIIYLGATLRVSDTSASVEAFVAYGNIG
jgi:hypothetical protein